MPEAIADAEPLYCPGCGFDLRATQSNRCGECGLEFDRATLAVSGIPWAHRRRIGRVRAYFTTVWQFTIDRRLLRHEAVRPQELSDARAFRRTNAVILAAALLTLFAAVLYVQRGLNFLAVHARDPFATWISKSSNEGLDPKWADLAVPWSAGATMWPVLPLCLIAVAFWLTGAQRFLFRSPTKSASQQQRGLCIAHYTTSSTILLLPAALLAAAALLLQKKWEDDDFDPIPHLIFYLGISAGFLLFIAIANIFVRTAQWLVRSRCRSPWTAALSLVELILLWCVGTTILLGLLPWCVGFFWIALDSLC